MASNNIKNTKLLEFYGDAIVVVVIKVGVGMEG